MERSVTKRVRLTSEEAAELARLAAELGISESDVLRMGLEDARARGRRLAMRRRNGHLLLEAAKAVPGTDAKPSLK